MDGAWGHLKLFAGESPLPTSSGPSDPITPPALSAVPRPHPDPSALANRELDSTSRVSPGRTRSRAVLRGLV